MANIPTIDDRFRVGKSYTARQAADLAGVSQGTVRNWLYGMSAPSGYQMDAVFGGKAKKVAEVARASFLELAELVLAARFRKLGIRLERVRIAHAYARKQFDVSHPFAHLDLTSLGGHILARFEQEVPADDRQGHFVVMDAPDQYVFPELINEELTRFDYSKEDKFAERWHPYGREVPIVVDPHFAGGRPTIAGSGVSVEIVRRRWKSGEKVAYIAYDYQLRRSDVEAVLQHVA